MDLFSILEDETGKAVLALEENGFISPGHNGPYMDKETPVRNTAHWLFTLSQMYDLTGEEKYKKAAEKAISYLLSSEARPMGAAFWIRKKPEKDFCNGVIGQAWVMEALLKAWDIFDREDCYRIAEEVFNLHHFDEQLNIWHRLNVDGSWASPDPTFNHQLWMGAVASFLRDTPRAREHSRIFFDKIAIKVRLYRDGVINHVSPVTRLSPKIRTPKKVVEGLLGHGFYHLNKRKLRRKSAGYHAFNLYAFALFSDHFSDHPFWKSRKFQKMLKVTAKPSFVREQNGNPYSYPYNPTGYELAWVYRKFNFGNSEGVEGWVQRQREGVDAYAKLGKIIDRATLNARDYELIRLLELEAEG